MFRRIRTPEESLRLGPRPASRPVHHSFLLRDQPQLPDTEPSRPRNHNASATAFVASVSRMKTCPESSPLLQLYFRRPSKQPFQSERVDWLIPSVGGEFCSFF